MYQPRRGCALLALAVAVAGVTVIGGGGAAAVVGAPEPLAAASLELVQQEILARLTAPDWRVRLSSLLTKAAAAQPELSLTGSAHGAVLGGTVHLPSNLALDGDTTIVAQRIVLSSPTLRVTGSHALRLYPVAALSVAGQTSSAVITIDRTGAKGSLGVTAVPPIDRTGTTGSRGDSGAPGEGGIFGTPGTPGRDAILFGEGSCEPATHGGPGGNGGNGSNGRDGTAGGDGGNGGDIVFDVPDGSTDIYELISRGGQGGDGGDGGPGGDGGGGGFGGYGGNGGAFAFPAYCRAGGNGGFGGSGGAAGSGGNGAGGGFGGEGGEIAVTYPIGYNPADVHTSVNGGKGGAAGHGGTGGTGGRGGAGGPGGTSIDFPGFDGADGIDGPDGTNGFGPSRPGGDGEDGAVEFKVRTANDDICAGMQSQQDDYADLRQLYHNLLATDPFPAEEPPESALPNCPAPPPPPGKIIGARDVAFGDSYISGEGAPPFDTNPELSPTAATNPACHVSLTSWVALVHTTGRLLPGGQQGFQNWACSGANIADTDQQVTNAIAAAQANGGSPVGLGVNTKAVQIMVGGNDVRNGNLVGFGQILACALKYGATHSKDAPASGCLPEPFSLVLNPGNQFETLRPRLFNLYERIAQAAPNAIIEVVGYPFIFPTRGPRLGVGGCSTGLVTADEAAFDFGSFLFSGVGLYLVVRDAAATGLKIRYVPLARALANHNVCPTRDGRNGTRRNTHGVNVPGNSDCGVTETVCWFHPNNAGHRAMYVAYTRTSTVRFRDTASLVPPSLSNGTLVTEVSSNTAYVAAGGTLYPFNDPADITAAGYPYQPGTLPRLDPSQVALMTGPPANGTVLRDAGTGTNYVINCGYKTATGPTAGAVSVPGHNIADIPDGPCPPPPPAPVCGQNWTGPTLFPVNWSCSTPKGTLVMQGDGNLVIYSQTNRALWASNTAGNPGAHAEFNGAGDLAVYASSGNRLWSTNTAGAAIGGTLTFQTDGNLVIRNDTGGVVWASNTFGDPPPPPPIPAFSLVALHSGKCLDIPSGSLDAGIPVQQYTCHGGTNQQWRFEPTGSGTYLVKAVHSAKCLDMEGAWFDNGGKAQQWDCHGWYNQQWILNAAPQPGQTLTLVNAHSGRCLSIPAASRADGGLAHQWDCHGGNNQQFLVITPGTPPPPPPPLVVRSDINSLYVSAELAYGGDRYGELRARAYDQGSWEQWTVVPLNATDVALRSDANGLFVSAELAYGGDRYATLRARAYGVGAWEVFRLVPVGDNTYAIQSVANGLYVSAELGYYGDRYGTLRARAGGIGSWEVFTTSTAPPPSPPPPPPPPPCDPPLICE